MGVNRWKAIFSLLSLAMWLSATQHCKLENLPGCGFLRCATDTPGNSDCQGDSCDAVERGMYKNPDSQQVTAPPVPLVLAWMISEFQVPEPGEATLIEVPTSAPPDLPKGWQFLTRTAAPPRAPTSVA